MRLTSNALKIYSPGESSLTAITNSETVTTGPWVWNGDIQFLDADNDVQQIQDGILTVKDYLIFRRNRVLFLGM